MVKLNLHSAPTSTNLLPLSTVKNFLRVTNSAEDTIITSMITAGIEVAQNFTNTKFLQHTYNLTLENWSDVYVSNTQNSYLYRDIQNDLNNFGGFYSKYTGLAQFVLPYPPLVTVGHIKYYDTSNVQQTWSASNYHVNKYINQKGFVEVKNNIDLPDVYDRGDAIEIRFTCGYGDDGASSDGAASVPEAIKQAVLLIIGKMYELREDSVSRLPKASEYILEPYRVKTY